MKTKRIIKDLIFVLAGNGLLALSVALFILPHDILSGGVAGIAVALHPLLHLDTTLIINAMVLGMFVLGCLFLGRTFALKTVISSVVYPMMLTVFTSLVPQLQLNELLAALYGGLLAGAGIGLVMRTGASTGGMDIPPLILHRYTGIKVSTLVMVTDALTVLLGLFVYGLEAVLVGFVSVWATSLGIDKILTFGLGSAKAVQIISDQALQINDRIHTELDRGTTLLQARGGYTQTERTVILVVLEKKEYPKLLELVHEIDSNAFMITSEAADVRGEGFSPHARV